MKMLLDKLTQAETVKSIDVATKAAIKFIQDVKNSEYEKAIVRSALQDKVDSLIESSKEMIKKTDEIIKMAQSHRRVEIVIDGESYSNTEWMTFNNYCQLYDIKSTSVINNWISRGIVPKENILEIKEYNNLKLIRAVPYKV